MALMVGTVAWSHDLLTGAGIRVVIPQSGFESFLGLGIIAAYCCIISATCWQNESSLAMKLLCFLTRVWLWSPPLPVRANLLGEVGLLWLWLWLTEDADRADLLVGAFRRNGDCCWLTDEWWLLVCVGDECVPPTERDLGVRTGRFGEPEIQKVKISDE